MRASSVHRDPGRLGRRDPFRRMALLALLTLPLLSTPAAAASELDLGDTETLLRTGKYDECAKKAAEEIGRGLWSERWVHLKIKAEMAQGKTSAAVASLEEALRRFPASAALHLLGRDVYRACGR